MRKAVPNGLRSMVTLKGMIVMLEFRYTRYARGL